MNLQSVSTLSTGCWERAQQSHTTEWLKATLRATSSLSLPPRHQSLPGIPSFPQAEETGDNATISASCHLVRAPTSARVGNCCLHLRVDVVLLLRVLMISGKASSMTSNPREDKRSLWSRSSHVPTTDNVDARCGRFACFTCLQTQVTHRKRMASASVALSVLAIWSSDHTSNHKSGLRFLPHQS